MDIDQTAPDLKDANLDAADQIAPAADQTAPDRPLTLESLAAEMETLRTRVARLSSRDVARRAKMLALQAAVVRRFGDVVCRFDDVIAPVFPIEYVPHAKPVARLLAFGSMGDNFGMTTTEFFKQLQAFDIEVWFFKDFEQIWYMKGLLGLSSSVDETAEVIRGMLPDRDLPLLTLGASSGGFAALLFGHLLGADRVLAFSPQTEVSRRVFSRFASIDSEQSDRDLASPYVDLLPLFQAGGFAGQAMICFADRTPFDAQQARRLDGCQGVVMNPVGWNGHNTAHFLSLRNQLAPLLGDFVAGTGGFVPQPPDE